jgi:hypothetical protein
VFAPGDVADLRATLERALQQRQTQPEMTPNDLARGAVLYDAGVAAHVDALLRMARRIDASRNSAQR